MRSNVQSKLASKARTFAAVIRKRLIVLINVLDFVLRHGLEENVLVSRKIAKVVYCNEHEITDIVLNSLIVLVFQFLSLVRLVIASINYEIKLGWLLS